MNNISRTIFLLMAVFLMSSCSQEKLIPHKHYIPVQVQSGYQFVDKTGATIINPQFSKVSCFYENLALARHSGEKSKWGYIDKQGNYKIQPEYLQGTIFSEGIAFVVKENTEPIALDKNGSVIFTLQNIEEVMILRENLAPFCKEIGGVKKWGFIDKNGRIVINPQFRQTRLFSDGLCAVCNDDDLWGYIDRKGILVINYQYTDCGNFQNGYVPINFNNAWGVIDKETKFIINPQFEELHIDDNRFLVKQDSKFGWIDRNGKFEISAQFDAAFPFKTQKLTPVRMGQYWGYIDLKGKLTINPNYEMALPFDHGIALIMKNHQVGIINSNGEYTANPQFISILEDYLKYLQGDTEFKSVVSDYFDVNPLLTRLRKDMETTGIIRIIKKYRVNGILAYFDREKDDISKNNGKLTLERDDEITQDINIGIVVSFPENVWEKTKKSLDIYVAEIPFNVWKFHDDKFASQVEYKIKLSDKGYGKETFIHKNICGLFSSLQKNIEQSDDKKTVFTGTDMDIVIEEGFSEVIVKFQFKRQ